MNVSDLEWLIDDLGFAEDKYLRIKRGRLIAVPQTCHSGEGRNPGDLAYLLINYLLDTGLRRYDAIPVLKYHVH